MTAHKHHQQTQATRHTMWTCPATFVAVAKTADAKRIAGSRLNRDRYREVE